MNFRRKSLYELSSVMQQCNWDAMLTNEQICTLTGMYSVGYNVYCVDDNAQCDKLLNSYCVCQCNPGYVISNGHCVKGYISIASINWLSHWWLIPRQDV